MEFLGDAGVGALVPDDAELRADFTRHLDRFTPPARITFRQVFLGEADPTAAQAALAEGSDPDTLGQATLLPRIMEAAAPGSVDGTFGDGFFAAISGLDPGEWRGPVESAFGSHLVQLVEMEPAVPPSFEAARGAVKEDRRRETAERLRDAQFQPLRERYEVVMPPPGP
jgi:PPIC-type PPIASE domain